MAVPFDGRPALHDLLSQAYRATPVALSAETPTDLLRGAEPRLAPHAPRFLALLESLDPDRVAEESARLLDEWIDGTERRGTP